MKQQSPTKSLFIILALFSTVGFCTPSLQFKEGEHLDISLSKQDYNRIVVKNDKLAALRFPRQLMSVQKDKDGSVYVDLLDDRPFTFFATTEKGKHFSATVHSKDTFGQTITLTAKYPKKIRPHHDAGAPSLIQLLKITKKGGRQAGFSVNASQGEKIRIRPGLELLRVYEQSGYHLVSQKFVLTNTSRRATTLSDNLFKDKFTKALLVEKKVLQPHEHISVVRVQQEGSHV